MIYIYEKRTTVSIFCVWIRNRVMERDFGVPEKRFYNAAPRALHGLLEANGLYIYIYKQ